MRKVITRIQLFKDPGSQFGNQVEGYLDVNEDAEFPINFSIGDIRDISKRSGSFSKTIKLSGSKNNNLLLNNYFEVNVRGTNQFNLNKKQRCAVIQNGVVILDNCYLRLINVKKVQSHSAHIDELVDYEVEIRDNVGDFFNEINNKDLSDLNLSEFNHIYNTANVVSSYTHSWIEGYSYVMPWIGNDTTYSLQEFVPGVFAKTYWDKIHSEAGFVYEWDELSDDNVRFDKLIVPYSGDKKKLTEEDKDFNEVIAETTATQSTGLMGGFNGSVTNIPFAHILTPNEIKDLQGFFDDTNSLYNNVFVISPPNSLVYQVDIEYDLIYRNAETQPVVLVGGSINRLSPKIKVFNQSNQLKGVNDLTISLNTSSDTVVNVCNLDTNNTRVNFLGSGGFTWSVGDTIVGSGNLSTEVVLSPVNNGEILRIGVDAISIQGAGAVWRIQNTFTAANMKAFLRVRKMNIRIVPNSDSGLLPNTPINLNRFIPKKVKQSEFVKSILQKYNLYVEIDKTNPNQLIYKTRDKYYDEGELKDWTYLLSKNNEQILEFVPEIKNKRTILSYKDDDNDFILKSYKDETGETYGQIEVIFDNENTRGDERKEEIFSPTINLWTDFGANLPVLNADFKYNLRILLHNGVKSCGGYTITESPTTSTSVDFYPFLSMLDEIENPNFDIAYGVNDYYPYDIKNYTSNNLYTNFWRRTFAQINSGKMMTAYFWLNEEDIFKLKLSDKVKVNNALWYINKIIDYKANKNVLTKVELLSVEDDLRLPRFGRIIRPVLVGKLPALEPDPIKPVGPIRPIVDAVKDVIRLRNNYTSVDNEYNGSINLGNRNIINTSNAIIIGNGRTINEDGFHIGDTKLVEGGLELNKDIRFTESGLYYNGFVINENGFGLDSSYVLGGYIDDGYFVMPTTASMNISYDDLTNETTINITADNVLINGQPIYDGLSKINSVSANTFSVADYDLDVFLVGNGSNPINIYLPEALTDGVKYTFKDRPGIASTYNVSIYATASDTIDGTASYTMTLNHQSITVVAFVGYGWFII